MVSTSTAMGRNGQKRTESGSAFCDGFSLVSWLEPDREAAEAGIRAVVAEAVERLRAQGRPLPEPGVKWPPQQSDHRGRATSEPLA